MARRLKPLSEFSLSELFCKLRSSHCGAYSAMVAVCKDRGMFRDLRCASRSHKQALKNCGHKKCLRTKATLVAALALVGDDIRGELAAQRRNRLILKAIIAKVDGIGFDAKYPPERRHS